MSIALIVTSGFGNGTFSGVIGQIVTRGYISGVSAPAPEPNPNVIEPVSGGTASSKWPSRQDYRKKRQAILDDDQDFLDLIEAAMPEIIKFLRK